MEKVFQKKIEQYNRKRRELEDLRREITWELHNRYHIDAHKGCYIDGQFFQPYSEDGVIPIYEWGSSRFDTTNLEALIGFIEDFREKNGVDPDISTICRHFKEENEKLLLNEDF